MARAASGRMFLRLLWTDGIRGVCGVVIARAGWWVGHLFVTCFSFLFCGGLHCALCIYLVMAWHGLAWEVCSVGGYEEDLLS